MNAVPVMTPDEPRVMTVHWLRRYGTEAAGAYLDAARRLLLRPDAEERHLDAAGRSTAGGAVLARTLTDLCAAATDSGLLIERLLEPPRETMRARSPEDDAKLHAQPGLLVLRLHAAT